jgi:3',5'-cyclic AMP phosphodiesterase CpdA|uniref:metallophosphoesterase family protein n=1 Tax=Candidatus Cryptobacteroides bacterium TaxID=3085639 RepID=UPI004028D56E
MNIKKMSIFILAALVSATTFLSCNVKEDNGGGSDKEPEKPTLTEIKFKAELPDAPAGFKTTWSAGDEIVVYSVKGNFTSKETMKATDVTSDGKIATFVSTGKLLKEAEYFYGMLKDCGIKGFKLKQYWSTDNMDRCRDAVPSVTVAGCDKNDMTLKFQNMFSLLSVTVTNPDTKYVKVSGNNGEVINKNAFIAFADYTLSDNPSPDFESTVSIRKYVNGAGTYHIGLRPDLLLNSGYTIVACDASDNVIGRVASYETLETEPGKVYNAGEIEAPHELSPVFDESKIALSLAAISDVHIEGSSDAYANKFTAALNQLKAKAAESDANGIDGVLVVGDLIQRAEITMAQNFKALYEDVFKPTEVPMIYTIGNHDMNPKYDWTPSTVAQSVAMANTFGDEYFKTDIDNTMRNNYEARHCVIGGYHILAVTPNGDQPITYSPNVITWLDQQLDAITKTDPNRYVIVLTHPMIYNTIYGSLLGEDGGVWTSTLPNYWATRVLTGVLEKYPQVVSFHGHLHFPINDPRSLWQGKWTALGCGSTRYMAIEPAGWEGISSTPTVMNDANNFSQGYLVQFDVNGNMRIVKMDFFNNGTIGEPYVMQYPDAAGANLAKYNNVTRKAANQAPTMSTIEAKDVKDNEAASVTFAAGKDDEFVHHYVITLSKAGNVAATKKILADFYLHPKTSEMKSSWTVDFGTLSESGQYTVTVVAVDSWDAESAPVSATFNCGDVTPSEKVELWENDKSGSRELSGPVADNGKTAGVGGWLSYKDGVASWTENTTGAPRTATLELSNGSKITVNQVEAKDLAGNYTFYNYSFKATGVSNTKIVNNDKRQHETTVEFKAVENPEILNGHVHNLDLVGLYLDFAVPASLEIVDGTPVIYTYMSLDYQKVSNGSEVACITELTNTTGYGKGYFAPLKFGVDGCNHAWIGWGVDDIFGSPKFGIGTGAQRLVSEGMYCCGFSFVTKGYKEGGYTTIYQFNYNNKWTYNGTNGGGYFAKK